MSFFAPLMLLGLLGIAVPVVFHLLHRRSTKTVVWGAYRFLMESLASRRRRMQLEELLLLACRCLGIAFLALALARPFVPQLRLTGGRHSGDRDLVIVLDASSSMGIRQADGKTNFERALDEARKLVKEAPRGTGFGIVLGGAVPKPLTPAPLTSKREVFALLDSCTAPGSGTMNAFRTLSASAMVLAAGNRPGKQIVLYGDGQATGWEDGDESRWAVLEDVFGQLPVKPLVVWRTLELPPTIRNLAVRDVVPSREVVGLDREVAFRVTIANTGTEAVTPDEVVLSVGGAEVAHSPVGRVLPGMTQTVTLRHRFRATGAQEVSATIVAQDDLPSDDVSTTVLHVIDSLNVLLVEGHPEASAYERASAYLAAALRPDPRFDGSDASASSRDFLVRPQIVPIATLESPEALEEAAVVVLADVSHLPAKAASSLADYVSAGGGLLVLPGDKARPDFYNGWKFGAEPVLPFPLGEMAFADDPENGPAFAMETFNGEALSSFRTGSDLGQVRVSGWRTLEEPAAGTGLATGADEADAPRGSVEGRLSNGAPLLASRSLGRGRVLLSAIPFDASLSFLPARGSFVPFAHELVYWLSDPTMAHLNLAPTDGATLRLSAGGRVEPSTVQGLEALYWSNRDWRGAPSATGTVSSLMLDWKTDAPAPGVPADHFTARFTGLLAAKDTDDYEFRVHGDDWSALWIDGKPWRGGRIHLTAGQSHSVRVDFREDALSANLRFEWHSSRIPWAPVPPACFFRYSADEESSASVAAAARPIDVEDPDHSVFRASLLRTSQGPSIRIARPLSPGVYRIHLPEPSDDPALAALAGTNGVIPFSVLDRAEEGNIAVLSPEALENVRRHAELVVASRPDEVMSALLGKSFGIETWRPLAFLALAMLLAEILLTRWIAIGRRTGESLDIAFTAEPDKKKAGDDSGAPTTEPVGIPPTPIKPSLVALPIGFVVAWALLKLLGRCFQFGMPWPVGVPAAILAFAFAALLFLYDRERAVVSRLRGRFLFGLRLLSVFIVVWMLLQPVLVYDRTRRVHRRVAVLLDDSLSMGRLETQWTDGETFDAAQSLGLVSSADRPLVGLAGPLSETRTRIRAWHERVALQAEQQAPKETEWTSLAARIEALGDGETSERRKLEKELSHSREDEFSRVARAIDWKAFGKDLAEAVSALEPFEAAVRPLAEAPETEDPAAAARRAKAIGAQTAIGAVRAAAKQLDGMNPAKTPVSETLEPLHAVQASFDVFAESMPDLLAADDLRLAASLPAERYAALTNAVRTERFRVAASVLAATNVAPTLLSRIADRYDVEFYRFGTKALKVASPETYLADLLTNRTVAASVPTNGAPATASESMRLGTDYTRVLEQVLDEVPSEELAGALLLTDGRHTGETGIEAVARRFGQAGAPVSSVFIGGTKPKVDLAVADVRAAESVFLGDRVRCTATVLAGGLQGHRVRVRLLSGDQEIEGKELDIASDEWSREVRFSHEPAEKGVCAYRVEAVPLDEETETENNVWDFEVSVSDDRTNVLLVDRRPRWEFRYLRNLFHARDKSVHLQYHLVEPDQVSGQPLNLAPASAAREFGDSEAGSLPVTRDEWRAFDVIILGDVGEDLLTDEVVENIRFCVEERGALLVLLSGARSMPWGLHKPALLDLLPVVCTNVPPAAREPDGLRKGPEDSYRIVLTPAGRAHECMSLSASVSENERLWASRPNGHWRLQADDVKPGAEVLAFAEPVLDGTVVPDESEPSLAGLGSAEDAVKKLAEIRRRQSRNALFVVKGQGRGKVAMLLTDETWRLRYREGDTYHHRFWGQILRWGVGEKLRAGNAYVRLGSDRLLYAPDEPVRVRARITNKDFSPYDGKAPEAVLSCGDKTVRRVVLEPVPDSNGLFETILDPPFEPGSYTIDLDCPDAVRALAMDYPSDLRTSFTVDPMPHPIEFVHTTASPAVPALLARLSGGTVATPATADRLVGGFGEPGGTVVDHLEIPFWNRGWLLVLLLLFLTAEWTLRKRSGLA